MAIMEKEIGASSGVAFGKLSVFSATAQPAAE